MHTYNKGNTSNVKQARKQTKELRKLEMASGSTITIVGETDEAKKVVDSVLGIGLYLPSAGNI